MRPLSPLPLTLALAMLLAFLPAAHAAGPEEAVDAYHRALADGDRETALSMLVADLALFEDGRPELSRDEYSGSHLKADMKFSRTAERTLRERRIWQGGNTAIVGSTYRIKGKSRGRTLLIDAAETMTLQEVDGQWKIVHIHWSNHVLD